MEAEANKTVQILGIDRTGTDPYFRSSIETNYSVPTSTTETTDITSHPPGPPEDFSTALSILTVTIVGASIFIFMTVAAAFAFYWFRRRRSRNSKAPETGWISTVNTADRSDGDDWIELKVLPKVLQSQTDVTLELNEKDTAHKSCQKNRRQNRIRSRTVCFSDKLLVVEKQVLAGQVSSQEDEYSALDDNFFQVGDNKYFTGWSSTLPNRRKFSQSVTNNVGSLKTAGETTTNWNKTNFVTFRRHSHAQESMEDPNDTKSSVFEGPHPPMNSCQSQNQNQDNSSMTSNDALLQQRQNTAPTPFQLVNIVDLKSTNGNECSYFVENSPDFDFPPLPTSMELLQSTVERGEVYENDLFESFKQTMSAKGIVFYD